MQKVQKVLNILLLGDNKVGKSSFVVNIIEETFYDSYEPTYQTKEKSKNITIQNQTIHIHLTDTTGSRKQYDLPIIDKMISNSDGIIVMFDLTRRSTLQVAKFWMDHIRLLQIRKRWMITIAIGTKFDGQLDMTQDQIYQFSKKNKCQTSLISSKTSFNILQSLQKLTKDILKEKKTIVEEWKSKYPIELQQKDYKNEVLTQIKIKRNKIAKFVDKT